MQYTRLRFADKYIGIVICFVFSVLNKFKFKKKNIVIKNVLVMELFEMGAAIMIHSCFLQMQKKLQNPVFYCLTLESMKESWELVMPKENIFTINDKSMFSFATSLIKQLFILRKKNIDLIIDFELLTRISAIVAFLIKSKIRAGFHKYELEGLYRGSFYDVKCAFNQNMHISKNFLALTKAAIANSPEYPNFKGMINNDEVICPKYKSEPVINKIVVARLKSMCPAYSKQKLILVNPDVGSNLSVRNYPKEHYAKLSKKILEQYSECLLLLTGTKDHMPTCSYIEQYVKNKRCINFCGQTHTLKEYLELLSLADLLISNDSGPPHFAALTNTRTIAIFGPETPAMYGPIGKCVAIYSNYHCSPCVSVFNHKNTKCNNTLCVKSIAPETVFSYVSEILSDKLKYGAINNKTGYL